MKLSNLTVTTFGIFIFCSCGQNEGGTRITNTSQSPQQSVSALPVSKPVVPGNTPSAPIIPGGKLNPAHGQPGHRCDIAVGAPLPASTGSASMPVLNNPALTPPIQNNAATPPPTVQTQTPIVASGSGLNPAHGQPGHRCDIPVGQPLSSAPAQSKNATPASTVITPKADNTPDTMLAKGLNPAHGKPGHRCDIAVGQPLINAAKNDSSSAKTN